MNTQDYKNTEKKNKGFKKVFMIATLFFAGILVANTGHSQVYVHARLGLGLPIPRVYVAPAPVVYGDPYVAPAPYYEGYAPGPVVVGYGGGYGHGYYGRPVYRGGYGRFYGGGYRGGFRGGFHRR